MKPFDSLCGKRVAPDLGDTRVLQVRMFRPLSYFTPKLETTRSIFKKGAERKGNFPLILNGTTKRTSVLY